MNDARSNNASLTPADLLATENRLDRLGHAERSAARPGLEDRLLAATAGTFRASASEAPAVLASIGPGRPRMWRMAASIAVVGAAVMGGLWLAGRGPSTSNNGPLAVKNDLTTTPSLETDLASIDSELASLMSSNATATESSEEFAALESELAALENELADLGWDEFDTQLEESL